MLVSFDSHRLDKLPAKKQAHTLMCRVVNAIGRHYNEAPLTERVQSALAFIGMGLSLLQWAILPRLKPYEPIEPALYDSVLPESLKASEALWLKSSKPETPRGA